MTREQFASMSFEITAVKTGTFGIDNYTHKFFIDDLHHATDLFDSLRRGGIYSAVLIYGLDDDKKIIPIDRWPGYNGCDNYTRSEIYKELIALYYSMN